MVKRFIRRARLLFGEELGSAGARARLAPLQRAEVAVTQPLRRRGRSRGLARLNRVGLPAVPAYGQRGPVASLVVGHCVLAFQ